MSNEAKQERKLSTLQEVKGFAAFCFLLTLALAVCLVFLIGSVCYPRTVGLLGVAPYYTYVLFLSPAELRQGARWNWFSQHFFVLRWIRNFLHLRLVIPPELQSGATGKKVNNDGADTRISTTTDSRHPNQSHAQYIFAVFPHGANADFRVAMDGLLLEHLPDVAPNLRVLAATVLFRIPVIREIALWTGCVDARRSVAERLIRRGDSILVLPGGQAEQIRTVHGREMLYLRNRKGFIRLALQFNIPVVPVYVFGVSDYYHTSNWASQFRLWLIQALGVAIPLAWGLYGSIVCPLPVPTTVVMGEPIRLASPAVSGSPSETEIYCAHEQFCQSLCKLFDQHKQVLGYGKRVLEIH